MDPFRFEDNLANVCLAGLTARSIPAGTLRGNAESTQERVEVTSRGWSRASGQMALSNSGVWFHSHYSGTLAFGIITQVGGNHAANHAAWVSNVRTLMDRTTQFFTPNNLPCYRILRVSETASELEPEPKTDTHRTDLAFAVELGIVGTYVA